MSFMKGIPFHTVERSRFFSRFVLRTALPERERLHCRAFNRDTAKQHAYGDVPCEHDYFLP
jgi:hypothetical protein